MSSPTFVVRKDFGNLGWVVKFSHEAMGEMPVGPRLAKGVRFPTEIGTSFDIEEDAKIACERWSEWYFSQPYVKKPGKKNMKYVA